MRNIIGIDVGGTKITGIVYASKTVLEVLTIATPKNLFEFERSLFKLVDFLSAKQKIFGLGVGIAGLVDVKDGVVGQSPNIKFIHDLQLAKLLESTGLKKVAIDNDASCFARAELELGQGRKFENFLAFTLGTGIGGGIVINGQLYRGQNNFGAELGHAVLGAEFFETTFKRLRDRKDFPGAGKLIGRAFASFINIFAPEAIIVGGGYGQNESKRYLPWAKSEIAKYSINKHSNTQILISQLKNPGALGAALLIK